MTLPYQTARLHIIHQVFRQEQRFCHGHPFVRQSPESQVNAKFSPRPFARVISDFVAPCHIERVGGNVEIGQRRLNQSQRACGTVVKDEIVAIDTILGLVVLNQCIQNLLTLFECQHQLLLKHVPSVRVG